MSNEHDTRPEGPRAGDPVQSIGKCRECNERCIKLELPYFSGDSNITSVTWCVNGHVCVTDPTLTRSYLVVHDFRDHMEDM